MNPVTVSDSLTWSCDQLSEAIKGLVFPDARNLVDAHKSILRAIDYIVKAQRHDAASLGTMIERPLSKELRNSGDADPLTVIQCALEEALVAVLSEAALMDTRWNVHLKVVRQLEQVNDDSSGTCLRHLLFPPAVELFGSHSFIGYVVQALYEVHEAHFFAGMGYPNETFARMMKLKEQAEEKRAKWAREQRDCKP